MLSIALGLFTITALIGVGLATAVFKQRRSSKALQLFHVCTAAIGSVLVIVDAFTGDARVWINIGLAVVIIVLGTCLGFQRAHGRHPKGLVVVHGGLAVICYLILAYFVFVPR
jgi:hypothetical protein